MSRPLLFKLFDCCLAWGGWGFSDFHQLSGRTLKMTELESKLRAIDHRGPQSDLGLGVPKIIWGTTSQIFMAFNNSSFVGGICISLIR